MKKIFVACVLMGAILSAKAQQPVSSGAEHLFNNFFWNDSVYAGTTLSPDSTARTLPCFENRWFYLDSILYFSKISEWQAYKQKNPNLRPECSIDSAWDAGINDLVAVYCNIYDCHGKCGLNYGWNETHTQFVVQTTTYYGGCRAGGGGWVNWILIPKLAGRNQLQYLHVDVDDFNY